MSTEDIQEEIQIGFYETTVKEKKRPRPKSKVPKKKKVSKFQKKEADKKSISPAVLRPLAVSATKWLKRYKEFLDEIENDCFILKETQDGARKGIKIFEEMTRDFQVGSDLRTRNSKIKSLPWRIHAPGENESDKKQANELEEILKPVYRDLVTEFQEAHKYGYALVEPMWELLDGQVVLPSVKGWDLEMWAFDENGTPGIKTIENPEPQVVPMERIIHFTFESPRGNPFGRSILIEAFWPWYWKKHAILFWAIFCEKFGQPTIIGWHNKNAETDEVAALLDTLESIQSDTAVTLEEGWKIEFMEAKRSGGDTSYEAFVKYCDMGISKAILSASLTTNESQYGTKAQAVEAKQVTDEVIESDVLRIQEKMTKTVVRLLAQWNFNFSKPPELLIHYKDEDNSKEAAESDEIQQKLMPIPLDDLYQKYGWTKPEGDTPVVFNNQITTWNTIMNAKGKGQEEGEGDNNNFSKAEFSKDTNTKPEAVDDGKALQILKESEYIDAVYDTVFNQFEKALITSHLEKSISDNDTFSKSIKMLNDYKGSSAPLWEELLYLASCVAEYSVFYQTDQRPPTSFFEAGSEDLLGLIDVDYGDEAFRIIEPKEAVKYLQSKIPVKKEIWKLIRKEVQNSAFHLKKIDDLNAQIKIKEKMVKALKEGLTYRDFKKSVSELINTKLLNSYLRTSFNTNMFSALSVQNEKALLRNVDRFPYWRYSAILDSNTRFAHLVMHNFVARYDHPAWSKWTPPNGYNCRCRKVVATGMDVKNFMGTVPYESINATYKPDPGFEFNPINSMEKTLKKLIYDKEKQNLVLNQQIRDLEAA
jgi:SPP1 gp7 family putative phage head morphogenesis protein